MEQVDSEGIRCHRFRSRKHSICHLSSGIGRDVELTGTSLDITPFDLPSITLDQENLADLLNDPSFNGFSINNDTFRVTNSMLIPRTQSRRSTDISDNEIVFPLNKWITMCFYR